MSARGEATISVGSRDVRVLFTNRAILTAEKQLNKGIIQILNDFRTGGSYTDLVALLRVGMEAARVDGREGGKPISNSDAIDVLDAVGFVVVAEPVMEALAAVISYSAGEEADEDPNG